MDEPEDIPTYYELNYALSRKDALAMVSNYMFLIGPMLLAFWGVGRWFGVPVRGPTGASLQGTQGWLFIATAIFFSLLAGLAGKYLWLVAMCRVLDRATVGPLVAWGKPRRISRLDRALIKRLYKPSEVRRQERLLPRQSVARYYRLHVIAYGGGAVLALLLSRMPLMRGDPRLWQLAVFFGVLALVCLAVGAYARRKGL